jgi:transcriptional regulator with XRE-family HTH domain
MARKAPPPKNPTGLYFARDFRGLSQDQLAEQSGVGKSQISKLEKGERKLTRQWAERFSGPLEMPAENIVFWEKMGAPPPIPDHLRSEDVRGDDEDEREERRVPVVGYVQAGAQAQYRPHHESVLDRVDPPNNATGQTVAFEIRGDSLGELFDKWLVFFDDVRRPVTSDLVGKLCVVGLADGRVMVKKLKNAKKGRYTLVSDHMRQDPIENVAVDWAARVKTMVPR